MKKTIVTGIRATGIPHIGNYIGSIKPILELQDTHCVFQVVADLHAITRVKDPNLLNNNVRKATACYLACGLDVEKSVIWRQSHMREMTSVASILFSLTSTNEIDTLLNKKDDMDMDFVSYLYPLLMAADTLLVNPDYVFAGVDHTNGLKFIQDLAQRFNQTYGDTLKLPQPYFPEIKEMVKGLDGRKMSKSFNNTITILESEENLYTLIMDSPLYQSEEKKSVLKLISYFVSHSDFKAIETQFSNKDFNMKDAKQILFESINNELKPIRAKYSEIIQNPDYIDDVLDKGLKKVREHSMNSIEHMFSKIGLYQ